MKTCKKLFVVALFSLALSPAYASLLPSATFSAEPERARLAASVADRERVTLQLIGLGVDRADAIDRVAGMTDREVAGLQERINELPAGAGMSNTNLLLIIIILILIL